MSKYRTGPTKNDWVMVIKHIMVHELSYHEIAKLALAMHKANHRWTVFMATDKNQ